MLHKKFGEETLFLLKGDTIYLRSTALIYHGLSRQVLFNGETVKYKHLLPLDHFSGHSIEKLSMSMREFFTNEIFITAYELTPAVLYTFNSSFAIYFSAPVSVVAVNFKQKKVFMSNTFPISYGDISQFDLRYCALPKDYIKDVLADVLKMC